MKKKNLLMTAIAILGLVTTTIAQVPSYVPTNGLVGWWPFNGNANDESGNGNNGTVNGATLTTDRLGNVNAAYSFDGIDDFISGNSNNLNVQTTNKLTLASWVYVNQFAPAPAASKIITHTDASNTGQQYALSIGNDGSLYFLAGNGDFENNGPNLSPAGQIQSNTWQHLAVVISSDSVKLYLNGNMVMGKPENDVFPANPVDVFVFSSLTNTTFNKLFNGLIDDIGIWNRDLSPCEIVALYNGQNPTQPITACYETATFNTTTCQWDVTGTQPTQPSTACYETATFNTTTCQWDVTGTQPTQPTTACYETATFNSTTCQWDVTGTQPTQPTTACYETATFNTTTCQWDVTGTQPTQPTTACYETASFNTTTCQWDITGSPASISQPTNQTTNINNNAQFVVSSSDLSATYQWQTDLGIGFQNLNSVGQYIGTTNDTLIVSNVTMSNNNQTFRCIISSGSCTDTSDVAVLTVNNNLGINETSQDKLFSVFPNPAQSVINVKADSKLIGEVYTIYDNTGRVVLSGKLNSQNTTIELGNLLGGIYMFSIGDNMKQTFKVIKE
jgi:hypothetical protein